LNDLDKLIIHYLLEFVIGSVNKSVFIKEKEPQTDAERNVSSSLNNIRGESTSASQTFANCSEFIQ